MPADLPSDSLPDPAHTPSKVGPPVDDRELEFDSATAPAYEPPLTRLERRQLHRPAPASATEPETLSETPAAVPPPQGAVARLERKSGDGTKPFTRFVTRPETTVAADLASERVPAERVIPSLAPSPQAFGKIRDRQEPEYRPSRLQGVMDETWAHSRLSWLDNLGRLRTLLVALLITGVVSIIIWPYLTEVLRKRETGAAPVLAAAPLLSDADRQAAIRRAFDAYLAAPDFAGKLPWVLEPQRVEPRMKDFYQSRLEKDPAIASYEVSAPIRAGGEWWFTLDCRTPDGSLISVVMKETPGGGHLDWENFTAYGSMAWERFHTARPTVPQAMRVRLRLVEKFSAKHPREDFLAFEISHRSGPPTLIGYAPKHSRSGQLLADEPGLNEWKPVNLYLSWETAPGTPPSVLIGDLIRNNWLDAINAGPSTPASLPPAETTPVKPAILPALKP